MTETSASFSLVRQPLELKFRRVRLASRERLTPHYVRIRLEGEDLAGFRSLGADDHLRIFFPEQDGLSVEEIRETPSREYTPVAWGEEWLDLDFVIHGDEGPASRWAASAPIGSPAAIGGPRGSMTIQGAPDAWFLAGDETAFPAITRFVAQMDPATVGTVLVEVPDTAHELPLSVPAGVSVRWIHRGDALAGSALIAAIEEIPAQDRLAGSVFGFIAAEQAIVKPGRELLLGRWGLDADSIVVKGYWKRGDEEHHAPH